MAFVTFASFLALALSATAAPTQQDDTTRIDCFSSQKVAEFVTWNTECHVESGRTMGIQQSFPVWDKLCRPLPEDTHSLDVTMLADGCHIQAFRGPVCEDYPNNRLFQMHPGCLWTGGDIYKSFAVTCDNKTIDELVDNVGEPADLTKQTELVE